MYSDNHDCADEIKGVRLKVTPARIAVLKLLETHSTPIDASHFIEKHRELGVDRVTIFRILNSFVEKGLIKKLEFQEGKARFEIAKADHHHAICLRCGGIEDIFDCNLENLETKVKKSGFRIFNHNLEFFGICRNCEQKN